MASRGRCRSRDGKAPLDPIGHCEGGAGTTTRHRANLHMIRLRPPMRWRRSLKTRWYTYLLFKINRDKTEGASRPHHRGLSFTARSGRATLQLDRHSSRIANSTKSEMAVKRRRASSTGSTARARAPAIAATFEAFKTASRRRAAPNPMPSKSSSTPSIPSSTAGTCDGALLENQPVHTSDREIEWVPRV